MKTKEEILQYIQTLGKEEIVSRKDLLAAYNSGAQSGGEQLPVKARITAFILYYLGGTVTALGIALLIWRYWWLFTSPAQIAITLGPALASYLAGLWCMQGASRRAAAPAFLVLGAIVAPVGFWQLIEAMGYNPNQPAFSTLIAAIVLSAYTVLLPFVRNLATVGISLFYATWLFFALTAWAFSDVIWTGFWPFSAVRVLLAGLVYLPVAHWLSRDAHPLLSGTTYGLGSMGTLGASHVLAWGWHDAYLFWYFLHYGLVLGAFFLCVQIRSRVVLVAAAIFLVANISQITEYFSSGMGWPLALVVTGVSMIGAGFASLFIHRKYIAAG